MILAPPLEIGEDVTAGGCEGSGESWARAIPVRKKRIVMAIILILNTLFEGQEESQSGSVKFIFECGLGFVVLILAGLLMSHSELSARSVHLEVEMKLSKLNTATGLPLRMKPMVGPAPLQKNLGPPLDAFVSTPSSGSQAPQATPTSLKVTLPPERNDISPTEPDLARSLAERNAKSIAKHMKGEAITLVAGEVSRVGSRLGDKIGKIISHLPDSATKISFANQALRIHGRMPRGPVMEMAEALTPKEQQDVLAAFESKDMSGNKPFTQTADPSRLRASIRPHLFPINHGRINTLSRAPRRPD
jgi:hypothetical protein